MTQKLIDYGHKALACLLKEESLRSAAVLNGFRNCLYHNNIPFSHARIFYSAGEECSQSVINLQTSGIVSSHLGLALELYEKMERAHYPAPSAFSLVSLKESDEAPGSRKISGIRIPDHEFGKYVAAQLIRLCEKADLDAPLIFSAAGGKGTNQSVGLARLGHKASLKGETGADADSAILFETLEKNKVITSGIHRNQKMQTGKAYIYAEKNGESAISILPGANSSLTPEDIIQRQHLFQNACFCLISTEISPETAIQAAAVAKKHEKEACPDLPPETAKTAAPPCYMGNCCFYLFLIVFICSL